MELNRKENIGARIPSEQTWSGADLFDSASLEKSQNNIDEPAFARMLSNESTEQDSLSQKYGFDFIQGVPIQSSSSKIIWSRQSDPVEDKESLELRRAINNKPRIDIAGFMNQVAEYAKLGPGLKESRVSENASSRVSTAFTDSSSTFFRFSSGSKRAGSEVFGVESVVRNTSINGTRRSNSEVREIAQLASIVALQQSNSLNDKQKERSSFVADEPFNKRLQAIEEEAVVESRKHSSSNDSSSKKSAHLTLRSQLDEQHDEANPFGSVVEIPPKTGGIDSEADELDNVDEFDGPHRCDDVKPSCTMQDTLLKLNKQSVQK